MIDKTKSIAQQDENVSAVFMYGSFTKNELILKALEKEI